MARILVIEDNLANLELMSYLIEAFGHTPLKAEHGQAGLDLAASVQPDLIVCDIQMPGLDGYEVAKRLKANLVLRGIPLVAVTALAMVGDRDQILAAGFEGYIAKPIIPETFVAQIEQFLSPILHTNQAAEPNTELAEEPVATPRSGIKILIVDDRVINHDLMRSMLEPLGFSVQTASNVQEALGLAQIQPPNLVISDLHMPELSGFDLIKAFKSNPQLQHIKLVIHSATVQSEEERRYALQLGADSFLTRPMEPEVLLRNLNQFF